MTTTFSLRVLSMTVLACVLGGGLPGWLAGKEPPASAGEKELAILSVKALRPAPGDDALHRLLKERYNAALAEMQVQYQVYLTGRVAFEVVVEAAQRVVDSGLEVHDRPADRLALLTQYAELARALEKIVQARHEAGRISPADLEHARYIRADAEIRLLREKGKTTTPR